MLSLRNLDLGVNFIDPDTTIDLKTYFAPGLVSGFRRMSTTSNSAVVSLPPVSFSLQRRLFPGLDTFSVFEFTSHAQLPSFTLALTSQKRVRLGHEEEHATARGPPTLSGLALNIGQWTVGTTMVSLLPVVFGEYALLFGELGLQLKARLQAGLLQQTCILSASWNGDANTSLSKIGTEVGVGTNGVSLKLG